MWWLPRLDTADPPVPLDAARLSDALGEYAKHKDAEVLLISIFQIGNIPYRFVARE